MAEAPLSLESWSNFYVIVGSAAGGLTGLTFVVIALVADAHRAPVRLSGLRAFVSPTIVHFCSVLVLAALLNVPRHSVRSLALCLALSGLVGVIYSLGTLRELLRHRKVYMPVVSDWIWNALLPSLSYLALLIAGKLAPAHCPAALDITAGVSLLLLFIGIHNAWDIAVWFTAERPGAASDDSKPPVPSEPPAQ